jgi:RNA polymerase sigma factor (sigma-70 family)
MSTPIEPEDLARQALDGDREALDSLVRALQGDVYGLALRMLWNREDAEDATQEILVRIVTRLSQFGFRSRLKTWAYRLAVNYILDAKESAIERRKRLQHACKAVLEFTRSHCGLVSDAASCQCHRRVLSEAVAGFDEAQARREVLAWLLGEHLRSVEPSPPASDEIGVQIGNLLTIPRPAGGLRPY